MIRTGVMLGIDKNIQDNLKLGLAISFTKQKVDEKETSSSSDIKSYYGHLYLSHTYNNYFFTSSVSLARVESTNEREISFLNRQASSTNLGYLYGVSGLVGYEYKVNAFTFTPSFELEYASLHNNSLNESGASDVSLHITSHTKEFLKSTIGLDLSHTKTKESKYIKPNIHIKWVHEYLRDNDDINSNFITGGTSFKTTSREIYKDKGVFGGGFDIGFSKNLSLDLTAEGILTSNADTDYNLEAKFKFVY